MASLFRGCRFVCYYRDVVIGFVKSGWYCCRWRDRIIFYYRVDFDVDRYYGVDCRCGLFFALRLAGIVVWCVLLIGC